MDQRELYEQQVLKQKDVSVGRGLGSREAALFEWITREAAAAFNNTEVRIAELSIGDGQLSRAIAGAFPGVLIVRLRRHPLSRAGFRRPRTWRKQIRSSLID